MKRTLVSLLTAGALLATLAVVVQADETSPKTTTPHATTAHGAAHATAHAATGHAGMPMGEGMQSITGEIVDMGCYLGHGAKGADHASCASKCISNGMPMGLLTTDGSLYLLTLNHDDAGPFNQAKTMAAQTVTVSGPISDRNGIKGLEVVKIEGSTPAPAPKG